MLSCCNTLYNGSFSYVFFSTKDYCRKVEFGICPQCGCFKAKDFQYFSNGTEKIKYLTGKNALLKLEYWRKKINNIKQGSFSNQNVYYGDFKKTNKLDENNLPIYQQLRKNFNGQAEVIGEVETKVLALF